MERESVKCNQLVQDKVQWRAPVNMAKNIWATITFSRRTMLRGDSCGSVLLK
jgi:hypothetical protein